MPVTIIKTKERKSYRPLYHSFLAKHFSGDFETTSFPSWSDSPFFFCNFSLENGDTIGSYATFVLTNEKTYQSILEGKMKEHEMPPLKPGEYGLPYLYWSSFVVENRQHAPYLIKSIFGELATCVKEWDLMVTHVYLIAFTKTSERLARRYFFQQAGIYEQNGHSYPVMTSKVRDNPYLRAFIPQG